MLLLIVLVGVATYLPVLRNGFTNLDDPQLLVNNSDIRSMSPASVQKLFRTSYGGLGGYTPLVLVSYAFEYHLFGLDAGAFHATNLALHVLNGLLVFWLISLVGGSVGIGFVTALVFVVHPLHVEPVAWIQGRKDLMFSFFYLSALIAYVTFLHKGKRPVLYGLSVLFFAFSLFSKLGAMSFPLVALLLEWRVAGRIDRRAKLRSLPLWIMSGLFLLLAFMTHTPFFSQTPPPAPSYGKSLVTFFYSFVFCVGKVFAPFRLFPGYADVITRHPWQSALSLVLFAALGVLTYFAHKRKPDDTTFAVCFFIFTLLPTLPFHFFGQPYEDRYMYLPLIGVILILAQFLPTQRRNSPAGWLAGGLPVMALAILLGVRSYGQSHIWRDSLSLWNHAIASDPSNPIGYLNRADVLKSKDQYIEAMADYDRAERLLPDNAGVAQNKAGVYFKLGEFDKSLAEINRALKIDPLFYEAYISRGLLWGYGKRWGNAVQDFMVALRLNRTYQAYYYRALAYLELQDYGNAVEDLRAAYRIEPTDQVRDLIAKLSGR